LIKTKIEYEDELKYYQDIKIQLKSTTDTQFDEIQRILGKTILFFDYLKLTFNVHQKYNCY